MTSPAIPMNEAAERYSPEMADAFQKTLTDLPATKKSAAEADFFVAQMPRRMVPTVTRRTNRNGIN